MPALFAVTLFVSASLLFMVQPMVGKMILPLLGGSPAAWNTCMVFFQGLLLLGYLYAHNLTTRHTPGRQATLHFVVLGVTVAFLGVAAALSPNGAPVPVFRSLAPQGQAYPMFGVLMLLGVAIGLPFLIVSTSAPLLQKWFNYTGHPSAKDPYFLYAASNAGSLISLLGYPLFIEPTLTLAEQGWLFAGGFVLLSVLVIACGKAASSPLRPTPPAAKLAPDQADGPPLARKLRWMGLAFVPSSLMLGVTFHMTTDIASVPLLWVIPLALYLLTFIIAFARLPDWFRPLICNLSPVLTLLLVFVLVASPVRSQFLLLSIHLVVYFFTALLLHSELARLRPDPRHLTHYYLWMSLGGVLGGTFNALIAPVLFPQAYEYPIAIVIGCLMIPSLADPTPADAEPSAKGGLAVLLDVLIPVAMAAAVGGLTLLPDHAWFNEACDWVAEKLTQAAAYCRLKNGFGREQVQMMPLWALPCVICFLFIDRPVRFGLCVAAILGVFTYRTYKAELIVESDRSFFGILKVERYQEEGRERFSFRPQSDEGESKEYDDFHLYMGSVTASEGERVRLGAAYSLDKFYKLSHGTTLHGMQASRTPRMVMQDDLRLLGLGSPWDLVLIGGAQYSWDARQEPLTYYHRTGPVGAIFRRARQVNPTDDVAMVGLGTGSAAAYALPGTRLTFYEIDRTVINLVEHPRVMNPEEVKKGAPPRTGPFTFVDDARKRGATIDFLLGDARLKLEENKDVKYGLLLVDAFSSDSIPVHLLTRQALELYKGHLTEHGILALHISNRYIMLEPVVARLALETGLSSRVWRDNNEGAYPGKTASSWVVLAKTDADLGDAILGTEADTRFGAVAGGFGYDVYDNGRWGMYVFPWKKLKVLDEVPAWTDDYSDVLRVMQLSEIRAVRRFFGLPVPSDE